MVPHLIEFVHRLRGSGIPISMVEAVDAARALEHIDMRRREQVRSALSSTLIKNGDHRSAFDAHFDLYFGSLVLDEERPQLGAASTRAGTGQYLRRSEMGLRADEEQFDFLEVLLEALLRADDEALRALAGTAVRELGQIDPERSDSVRYYMHRLLRELDLGWVFQQGRGRIREQAAELSLDPRMDIRALEQRIAAFKARMEREIGMQLGRLQTPNQALEQADSLQTVEEMEFLGASLDQLRRMRHAVRPLARRLAAKLAQRRKRRNRGRLDVRKTVRRSLSTGGVPFDTVHRYRREAKPDLFLVADVSGSVSKFAEFTISFLNAMSEEFPKLRCFIFVDGVDEVTEHVKDGVGLTNVKHLIARSPHISRDGHSDHAKALDMFYRVYGHAISGTSTVIFTGDCRNNYRVDDAGLGVLKRIQDRAKQVYWLNPERRSRWGKDDSLMPEFRRFCDGSFEVRNLKQLQDFVLEIA